ncbi:MAG: glycosyltransferase family 2 protein [Actinomycetes bacterium]
MTSGPTVSVVVSCWNYERFVGAAIESALAQVPPPHEVVVVDDGSTDGSADRVRAFGSRVRLIEQANAGQAAAIGRGVAEASGDVVVLLDADDVLRPGILAEVQRAFAADPAVVKVHWRLELIDAEGAPTGRVRPPRPGLLADGDLRTVVLRTRNHAWPPTSANAFRRDVLERVLPIPDEFTGGPDKYLAETVALFGRLVASDTVGTGYRVHGDNNYAGSGTTDEWARRQIVLAGEGTDAFRRLAPAAGLDPAACPDVATLLDPAVITARLVSLRLAPDRHPIEGDRAPALAVLGVRSLLWHHALPWRGRARRGLWFVVVGLGPGSLARRTIARWTPDAPDHLTR